MRCLLLGSAALLLAACGGGSGNTYTSVADDNAVLELKSGGNFSFTVPGLVATQGTYTVDGDRYLLVMDGQTHTMIKTGQCLEDARQVFSRMCIGGKAGEAVTQGQAAPAIEGATVTWKATTADGAFTLEFKSGNTLAMSMILPGNAPDTKEGTYTVEGRVITVRLGAEGIPMVLTLVNGAWETNSLGIPMKFEKQ